MSEYLNKLKRFSQNKKLIYAEASWLKAISHIEKIEQENKELKADLSFLKKLINRNHIEFIINSQDELKRLIELNLTTEQEEEE